MAALTLTTDKTSYTVGETIVATLTVSGLAPGEDGWQRVADLLGTLDLSTGETVQANGQVTVTKDPVAAQTASNPQVTSDGLTFTVVSFDGTVAVLHATAA